MFQSRHIKKFAFAAVCIMAMQVALASFYFSITGKEIEKNRDNRYTLKNLGNFSHKTLTMSALRLNFQFQGLQVTNQKQSPSGLEVNSMLQFDRGNSTYIYPYSFKVKLPKTPLAKFKAPSNH